MRVYKFTNLSPVFLSIFIAAICIFGISAASAHAADFLVTSINDSGAGSLRQAIADAGAAAGDDTIDFALVSCPCTITLATGINVIDLDGLTVNGPGSDSLTVNANGSLGVFRFLTPGTKTLIGMTVTGGQTGIGNFDVGSLTLNGVVVTQNTVRGIVTLDRHPRGCDRDAISC